MTAEPSRPERFDEDRLRHLLVLVGPGLAPDLLRQLVADLSTCSDTILRGSQTHDWLALREASHNLISLAGSAGADGLHGMAQALNATAHARDEAALAHLVPNLSNDLAALIDVVRATPSPDQAAR